MKISLLLAAMSILCSHAVAAPQTPTQVRFEQGDWELACDNTRTCRAAGYSAEEDARALSVLLTRKGGPGQAVAVTLRLADQGDAGRDDTKAPGVLSMLVDGKPIGNVALAGADDTGTLSAPQAAALVGAMAGTGKVEWRAGKDAWRLSGKGATAVLLKMDEFQGRLDTRGAIVRTGARGEEAVLPPLPAPVITVASLPKGKLAPPPRERELLAALRQADTDNECQDLAAVGSDNKLSYTALSADKMLVSARCWRGAYNEGTGYWVARRTPPFAPVLVTAGATDFDKGVIDAAQKGRGIGDCWATGQWAWDGNAFVHTAAATTGMCRAIAAGGAWQLPTLVSTLRR